MGIYDTRLQDEIDVQCDFTKDTVATYWDGFWNWGRHGRSRSATPDPDAKSPTLFKYHQLLWSRELPNKKTMQLKPSKKYSGHYLEWNGMTFSSDSITTEFRGRKSKQIISLLDDVADSFRDGKEDDSNYRRYVKEYLHDFNTIGGFIIFPTRPKSVNTKRSYSPLYDRWDLTLECIRRHYCGEKSPLSETLKEDHEFFDLFVDFKGYVEFFFLEDCIVDMDADDLEVKFWIGNGDLKNDTLPRDVAEYRAWIEAQRDFVRKRNQQIENALRA